MAVRPTWVNVRGVILLTAKWPELECGCKLPCSGESQTVDLYCCYLSRLRGMLFNWANGPPLCFWYTEQVRWRLTYFDSCSGGSRFQSEPGHGWSDVITTCPPRNPTWYLKNYCIMIPDVFFRIQHEQSSKYLALYSVIFSSHDSTALVGLGLLFVEVSRSHSMTHTHTLGRTPPYESSTSRRDFYLTTFNTHNRQTSIPPAGFEPSVPKQNGRRPHGHFAWLYSLNYIVLKWTIIN